jgi:DNA-binding NarL/FixJ family response regulator
MNAFAERARRELLATRETARKRTARLAAEPSQQLTAQEMQVARLARGGLSNPATSQDGKLSSPGRSGELSG